MLVDAPHSEAGKFAGLVPYNRNRKHDEVARLRQIGGNHPMYLRFAGPKVRHRVNLDQRLTRSGERIDLALSSLTNSSIQFQWLPVCGVERGRPLHLPPARSTALSPSVRP